MISWNERSPEERGLLNPGFCSILLWKAMHGYHLGNEDRMSFEESFLILPIVLHRPTRELLPRSITTSLAVWLVNYPLARQGIAIRSRAASEVTREAIMFGGMHGCFRIEGGKLHETAKWGTAINKINRDGSFEVQECAKKAMFLGKWFKSTGSPSTVLALFGVRP